MGSRYPHCRATHRKRHVFPQAEGHTRFAGPGIQVGRLLDNLPGVPLNAIDVPDVSAGQNLWDKNQLWPQWVQSIKSSEAEMEKTLELDQDTNDENVPMSSTDELSSGGGLAADRTRKLGEFSRTIHRYPPRRLRSEELVAGATS